MKLGVAYAFIWEVYKPDPAFQEFCGAVDMVAELGLNGIELEAVNERYLRQFYTKKRIKEIRDYLDFRGLAVPNFQCFTEFPPTEGMIPSGLVSPSGEKREAAIKTFGEIIEVAKELTRALSITNPPLLGLKFEKGPFPTAAPSKVSIPIDFSWKELWKRFVNVLGRCADMAQDAGMRITVEPRQMELITTSDCVLRLFEAVGSNNLGVNLDTANLFVQKEILPIVIEKLGNRISHIHIADNDGSQVYHYAPGKGKIDWQEFLIALKKVGYDGFLSLEFLRVKNPLEEYIYGKNYMKNLMDKIL